MCLIFHKEGHALFFDIATTNISYSGRRCQLLFFHDVTERKKLRKHWKRSIALSSICCNPATTNDKPSPTKSMMALPSIWPGPSCSSKSYKHHLGEKAKRCSKGL